MTWLDIPPALLAVRYNGEVVPGSASAADLSNGANCQVFAYALLRHHGRAVPDLRSSELRSGGTTSSRFIRPIAA